MTELPLPRREKQLLELLKEVAALQREVDEDVRFNEKAVSLLGAGRGVGVGTLWNVAETWLAYLDGRASGVSGGSSMRICMRDCWTFSYGIYGSALPEVGMDVGDDSATLALSELPRDLRAALDGDARRADAFSAIVRREKSRLLARRGRLGAGARGKA